MPSSSQPSPSPHGRTPLHTVQILGSGNPGPAAHVRSLAAGLVARGVRVTVCAPAETGPAHDFTGVGARFAPLQARTETGALAELRARCADADLVHAHGVRAGVLATLVLTGRRRVPLVVTWHARAHAPGGRARLAALLERRVARAARVVLGASSELVERARRHGARDARLAPVALPAPRESAEPGAPQAAEEDERQKVRAELGAAGRPLVLTAGCLEPGRGRRTLLTAARSWRHLDPLPLVVVAGDGTERTALQRRIDEEELPVRLLGCRSDVARLLPAADLVLLTAYGEARSPLAQVALHAGVPLVAAASAGPHELLGEAAFLVPYGDSDALADAVRTLLTDPARRVRLVAAGLAQAATWPTEERTVTQVLSVYDELTPAGS